jgi:hypothetical protein
MIRRLLRSIAVAFIALVLLASSTAAAQRSSASSNGTGTTPSVTVPTGVATDDIIIIACQIDAAAADFQTADWPTGFTELAESDNPAGQPDGQTHAIGWKRATGADSGTYTFGNVGASGDWICEAVAFSGRDTTNPPIISSTALNTSSNASGVSVTANGVTALANDDLMWVGSLDPTDSVPGSAFTPPSSPIVFTERQDVTRAFCGLSVATADAVSAGATGTISGTATFSGTGAGYVAWTVRIPVSGGGGGSPTPNRMTLLGVSE